MSLGVKSWVSRLVKGRKPDGEIVDIHITPSEVPWEYVPAGGPYLLVRREIHGAGHIFAFDEHQTLNMALASFAARHRPLYSNEICAIFDKTGAIILFWEYDEGIHWAGCAHVFEQLVWHHDRLEVAVWETSAMERKNCAPWKEYDL